MQEIVESGEITITSAEQRDNPLLFLNQGLLARIKQAGGPVKRNIFYKISKGYKFTCDNQFQSGDKIVRWWKTIE